VAIAEWKWGEGEKEETQRGNDLRNSKNTNYSGPSASVGERRGTNALTLGKTIRVIANKTGCWSTKNKGNSGPNIT